MTDNLVGRLKASVTYEYMPMKVRRQLSEAAARIEALEAENRKLREAVSDTRLRVGVLRHSRYKQVPWDEALDKIDAILSAALTPEAPHAD